MITYVGWRQERIEEKEIKVLPQYVRASYSVFESYISESSLEELRNYVIRYDCKKYSLKRMLTFNEFNYVSNMRKHITKLIYVSNKVITFMLN